MSDFTSLFLSQSYKDAWADYNRSLRNSKFVCWDYVVLTASNDLQAKGYEAQINERKNNGTLPKQTQFLVIPDKDGKRVGSGGATLGVINEIVKLNGSADFSGLRILVIHSGGDSKRVPQYSALGKLFSPVPHELPDGRSSTLFDEFLIAVSSMPSRIKAGMVMLSGDVLLLFNPLQIDYSGKGAAAISFKEKVSVGKNHGVFLKGEDDNVQEFLHKQKEETLTERGAVNELGYVDIDTGAVIFSSDMLSSLFSLISTDGKSDEDKFNSFVNEKVRLSLYGDFLYPLATASTLEKFYNEKAEGDFCEELRIARKSVWDVLSGYNMKLIRCAPAKFIHFGTTKEILNLMSKDVQDYKELDWSRKVKSSVFTETAGYNSVLSKNCRTGDNCYLEVSYVHGETQLGNNVLLSYIDVEDEIIPDDVVLHGLKQTDGNFVVRIYGVNDNPKEKLLFGRALKEFVETAGIKNTDLWDTDDESLWFAKLYPPCENISSAIKAALNLYEIAHGRGNVEIWKNSLRKSLSSGFKDADQKAIIAWNKRMEDLVQMGRIADVIYAREPASKLKGVLNKTGLTPIQKEWLDKKLKKASFSEAIRLYYYIGKALGETSGEEYVTKGFEYLQSVVLNETMDGLKYNNNCKIAHDFYKVNLPLRVNWGGGWSDTPPYCIENGGTVLNAAILLNGEKPVEVSLEKIPEHKIIFDSRDMDVHGEFSVIEELQKTGDPYDPFVLQKSCLLACGIIPKSGGNLEELLSRLGGGFIMRSEVTNVPKGSGLGTSSILSAACVKAVFGFMGIDCNDDELYSHVLCMEQLMSTGGGWQDQVGGVTDGIKYISSQPGVEQKLKVQHIDLSDETKKELNERFVLIYTGQRRLARNLLREVVGRYLGNEPDSLYALKEIQRMAALMRFELERGNIDEFAQLLSRHWELSKMIDAGSTNTLIDQIFKSVDDLIDGKLVCGAGGGGFLQIVLKKGITKEDVHKRLKEVFQDSPIDIWNCTLI